MLKAIIIEDEELSCIHLNRVVESTKEVDVIGVFHCPSESIKSIQQEKERYQHINLAFIDIEMPGIDGLQLAQQIKQSIPHIEIVFTTAYSQYAVEAFEVDALDYILKPFTQSDVKRVLRKITRKINNNTLLNSQSFVESTVKVQTLGKFIVRSGKSMKKKVKFQTVKVEELFAYLLVQEGNFVDKWELCELLWPEALPKKAKSNLYTTIYRMKKTFEAEKLPFQISSNQDSCYLEFDESYHVVDYQQLIGFAKRDLAVTEQTRTEFEKAESLFHGYLFSERDYLWVTGYREQVNIYYRELTDKLIQYYIREKLYSDANRLLNKRIKFFPENEKAYGLLIEVYVKQNDRSSIIKLCKQYKEVMVKEMDIVPSESTMKLFQDLIGKV